MSKIKFQRVERACPANDAIRRESPDATPRGLIYDFHVVIDGDHRATLMRVVCGFGYEVHDADLRPIRWPESHRAIEIRNQANFEPQITALLEVLLIPTLAEMAEWRATEAAEKASAEVREKAERRAARIRACGVELYDTLKLISEKTNVWRQAVTRDNALPIVGDLNETLMAIRDLAASAMAMTLESAG